MDLITRLTSFFIALLLSSSYSLMAYADSDDPHGSEDSGSPFQATIQDAEARFQVQDYERVISLLDRITGHPDLSGTQEEQRVLEMQGVSHWFLGAYDASRLVFGQLLRLSPFYKLDPFLYPRELLDFYAKRREELINSGIISNNPKSELDFGSRKVLIRQIEQQHVPDIVYVAPFAIGQFANGDHSKGAALASVQALGLLTAIATWLAIDQLKIENSHYIRQADETKAKVLEAFWYTGSALFLGGWAYSIADGFLSRDDTPEVKEHFEYLEHSDNKQLRWSPMGLGAKLDLTF